MVKNKRRLGSGADNAVIRAAVSIENLKILLLIMSIKSWAFYHHNAMAILTISVIE